MTGQTEATLLKVLNLALLILFPIAWFAPLIRAALLPIFGMDEISVVTGPAKPVGLGCGAGASGDLPCDLRALCQDHWPRSPALEPAQPKTKPVLDILGKLAMADVFLIALYIVIVKGAGYGDDRNRLGPCTCFPAASSRQILISWQSKPAAPRP